MAENWNLIFSQKLEGLIFCLLETSEGLLRVRKAVHVPQKDLLNQLEHNSDHDRMCWGSTLQLSLIHLDTQVKGAAIPDIPGSEEPIWDGIPLLDNGRLPKVCCHYRAADWGC